MHHFQSEHSAAHITAEAKQVAGLEILDLTRIKIEEANSKLAALIGHNQVKRAARFVSDLGVFNACLNLRACIGPEFADWN
jgi:hypothetical protein